MQTVIILANNLQFLDNALPSALVVKQRRPDTHIVIFFTQRPLVAEDENTHPLMSLAFELADEIIIPYGNTFSRHPRSEFHNLTHNSRRFSKWNKAKQLLFPFNSNLSKVISAKSIVEWDSCRVWFDFWLVEDSSYLKLLAYMTTVFKPAFFIGFGHGLSFSSRQHQHVADKTVDIISAIAPSAGLKIFSGGSDGLSSEKNEFLQAQPNHRWSREWIHFVKAHCGFQQNDLDKAIDIGVFVSRPSSRNSKNIWGPSAVTKRVVEHDVLELFLELSLKPIILRHPNERWSRREQTSGFRLLHGSHPLSVIHEAKLLVSYGSSVGEDFVRIGAGPEIVYRPDFESHADLPHYPESRGSVVTNQSQLRDLALQTLKSAAEPHFENADVVPDLIF